MTNWTEEQLAYFEEVRTGTGSISLSSVSGSGKTTTMAESSKDVPFSLAVAFNVKNKADLEKKMKSKTIKTMNGLGHGALMGFLGKKGVNLDTKKLGDIVSAICKKEDLKDEWMDILTIARWMRTLGYVPDKSPGSYISLLTEDQIEHFIQGLDLDVTPSKFVVECAKSAVRESIRQAFTGLIDFDDQIYIPTLWGAAFQKYPVVFGDEFQDMNALNHKMLLKSLEPGGRLFAVGDPFQSIYGFRGAMGESMEVMAQKLNSKRLELSYCFRCGTDIIKHAQELVPHIKSPPGMFQGSVHKHEGWSSSILRAGDAILCRNNGPMISLAYRLIRQGIGVFVLGRDLGKGLESLIKKLGAEDVTTLAIKAKAWCETEVSKAKANRNDAKVSSVYDKYDTLCIVMEDCQTLNDISKKINLLFSRESAPIVLSTIHKAKGLEFPRVFYLNHGLLYQPWADWEQERNLDYVARTRAINELNYIELDNLADK